LFQFWNNSYESLFQPEIGCNIPRTFESRFWGGHMPETGAAPSRDDTGRNDTSQGKPSSVANLGLLDTIIVLILASMVVLFVTWLGTTLGGAAILDHLPEWLTKAASSIWTYLTGGASSTILSLLRDRTAARPNYLIWTFGTAAIILALVFGVFALVPVQKPATASLHFSLHLNNPCQSAKQNCPPIITLREKYPNQWFQDTYIAADSASDSHFEIADPHYHVQPVDWPGKDQRFLAHARQRVEDAQKSAAEDSTRLCFIKNINAPKNSEAIDVQMKCIEGKDCTLIDDEGPQWAAQCSQRPENAENYFQTTGVVYAAESNVQTQSGWQVPSLKTLESMKDQRKVGYTEFAIKGPAPADLETADNLRYLISANAEPLHVDGWSTEDMIEPFKPSDGLNFRFGLQNLSFSGADNGCENIQVALEFRHKDRVLRQVTLSRRYAALRDARVEEVRSKDGTAFSWSGTYIKPRNEDKIEVFVASTSSLSDAVAAKKQLDHAGLVFEDMSIVGVLRPPLDKPWYGIAAGLRQPTGQIRFTFDQAVSGTLLNWLLEKRRQLAKLHNSIRPDAHLYAMKPGESGVGKLNFCHGTFVE
jgi:hypothetical protein